MKTTRKYLVLLFILTMIALMLATGCSPREEKPAEESQQEPTIQVEETAVDKSDVQISDIEKLLINFAVGVNKSLSIINKSTSNVAVSIGESGDLISLSYNSLINSEPKVIMASYTIAQNTPPASFFEDIPSDGYIDTPTGQECPLGAAPYMMFATASGNNITGDYLSGLGATAVSYEILSLSPNDPKSIQAYVNQKLTGDPQAYVNAQKWNTEIWGTEGDSGLAQLQEPVNSIVDYHFWSHGSEIENLIIESIKERLPSVNTLLDAFEKSNKTAFLASPTPDHEDMIAQKNIRAEFSGDVEGTIYEARDFKLSLQGNPEFGPMHGQGEIILKNTEAGDIPFHVELEWTAWGDMGAPTKGFTVLHNEELGYKMEINTYADGTKDGMIYINDELLGELIIDGDDNSSYTTMDTGETVEFGQIY